MVTVARYDEIKYQVPEGKTGGPHNLYFNKHKSYSRKPHKGRSVKDPFLHSNSPFKSTYLFYFILHCPVCAGITRIFPVYTAPVPGPTPIPRTAAPTR